MLVNLVAGSLVPPVKEAKNPLARIQDSGGGASRDYESMQDISTILR